MPNLTDPTPALASLQKLLDADDMPRVQRGALHHDVFLIVDTLHGPVRFTYFTVEGRIITAFANLMQVDPMERSPCFQLGCAVPPSLRRSGRGKAIVMAAIDEFTNGFGKLGAPPFFIEAVVGTDNVASQHIAAAAINAEPDTITDSVSGLPAFHYVRRIEPKPLV